jgi:hypothetical protein
VGVHLLGELAGELDRLDLGAEGAAEDPLDEAFDPTLKVAQYADRWLLFASEPGARGGGETGLKSYGSRGP